MTDRTRAGALLRYPAACPVCDRPAGRACVTPGGQPAKPHAARGCADLRVQPCCPCGNGPLHHLCGRRPLYTLEHR